MAHSDGGLPDLTRTSRIGPKWPPPEGQQTCHPMDSMSRVFWTPRLRRMVMGALDIFLRIAELHLVKPL
jgi:hypothetical protein